MARRLRHSRIFPRCHPIAARKTNGSRVVYGPVVRKLWGRDPVVGHSRTECSMGGCMLTCLAHTLVCLRLLRMMIDDDDDDEPATAHRNVHYLPFSDVLVTKYSITLVDPGPKVPPQVGHGLKTFPQSKWSKPPQPHKKKRTTEGPRCDLSHFCDCFL